MPDTDTGAGKRWPGETDEAFPEVFTKIPTQTGEKKPGQLNEQQLREYFEEGVVVLEDFFKPEELEPCKAAIEELVEELAQKLYKAGKIKNLYSDVGLFQRLTKIEAEFPGANILLHKLGRLPQAFRNLWSNERLLNIVEQLIGPNIAGHPVWNLRTKTPQSEATTVPWHQDVGYLDSDSYKVLHPTAWIPLLDTNEENGCLEFVNRGHRSGKVCVHECCTGDTWYVMIREGEVENKLGADMKKDTSVKPVKYGGFVLFNNLIPHRSLNNLSNDIRWSFDFRWQQPELPYGFFGIKQGVLMRTADNPNHVINWESFDSVDRNAKQAESIGWTTSEFDTTIHGPWMKRWKIVHHNRHTASLPENMDDVSWHRPL